MLARGRLRLNSECGGERESAQKFRGHDKTSKNDTAKHILWTDRWSIGHFRDVGLAVVKQERAVIDEAELIERAKRGDELAYAQLYKRHARRVAAIVYRLLGSDHHLEDIVQETFVIALRQLNGLREPAALGGWLRTIAVRRVQRHLTQRYKQRAIGDELAMQIPRVRSSDASEEIVALYQALAKLPDKLRLPWMLHHIEGETLPAVAAMCETSLTSVKRRIAKAKEHLRRMGHEN